MAKEPEVKKQEETEELWKDKPSQLDELAKKEYDLVDGKIQDLQEKIDELKEKQDQLKKDKTRYALFLGFEQPKPSVSSGGKITEDFVLSALDKDFYVSIKEIINSLDCVDRKKDVQEIVKNLVASGRIKTTGQKAGTKYSLK